MLIEDTEIGHLATTTGCPKAKDVSDSKFEHMLRKLTLARWHNQMNASSFAKKANSTMISAHIQTSPLQTMFPSESLQQASAAQM